MSNYAVNLTYDTSLSSRGLAAYTVQAYPTDAGIKALATREPTWNNKHCVSGVVTSEAEAIAEIAKFVSTPALAIYRAEDMEQNVELRIGEIRTTNAAPSEDNGWRDITVVYRRTRHGVWNRNSA